MSASGIIIPTGFAPKLQSEIEAQKPQWANHMGWKGRHLPQNGIKKGGCVHFAKHMREGLTDEFWQDIVFRLKPWTLEIYVGNAEIYTVARQNALMIFLETDGKTIRDINWFPPFFGPAEAGQSAA